MKSISIHLFILILKAMSIFLENVSLWNDTHMIFVTMMIGFVSVVWFVTMIRFISMIGFVMIMRFIMSLKRIQWSKAKKKINCNGSEDFRFRLNRKFHTAQRNLLELDWHAYKHRLDLSGSDWKFKNETKCKDYLGFNLSKFKDKIWIFFPIGLDSLEINKLWLAVPGSLVLIVALNPCLSAT